MLDRRKHTPLYIQLKEEILDKIKEGEWKVDSKIPSEKTLMDEYNVGRATVREAVSLLENEGYLYKKRGIGTFVARKQPSLGFEPLISLTYSLKARGIYALNDIEEKKLIIPDRKLLNTLKWKRSKPCFYIKRLRYAEDVPLAVEESYFTENFEDILSNYDLTDSLAKIILQDLKITIKMVEQIIIPRMPTDEEQHKLKISEDTQVLNMQRWIYIEGREEPFYYLNFIIPSNIYSLSMY